MITKSHTPKWVTHRLGNNYIPEVLPQKVRVLSPISGSPAQGLLHYKDEPRQSLKARGS